MHIIDTALAKRAANGNPIKVGVIGAGFMSQGPGPPDHQLRARHRGLGDLQPDAGRAGEAYQFANESIEPIVGDVAGAT